MSTPFPSGHGAETLAAIGRATLPRDGVDEYVISHARTMETIERFGDRANVAHALIHARSLTVQAIDTAERALGDPCKTVEDVVNRWEVHRDAGAAIPVGHHSGQTVIGIHAETFEDWTAWLNDYVAIDLPRRDFDGRAFTGGKALREMGRYSVLTRASDRPATLTRSVAFMGNQGFRKAADAMRPAGPRGPVFALWVIGHRSNVTPAGLVAARPDVTPRSLGTGVRLMAPGDLIPVITAVGADTRVIGDVPTTLDSSSAGLDGLSSVLRMIWK